MWTTQLYKTWTWSSQLSLHFFSFFFFVYTCSPVERITVSKCVTKYFNVWIFMLQYFIIGKCCFDCSLNFPKLKYQLGKMQKYLHFVWLKMIKSMITCLYYLPKLWNCIFCSFIRATYTKPNQLKLIKYILMEEYS